MLITLLFHRVSLDGATPFTNKLEELKTLLKDIQARYPLVLPGERLSRKKLSCCITFDDAFYDFYHYLFPFLQEEKIPVVLAIIPGLVPEKSSLPSWERLAIATKEAFSLRKKEAFCSWQELREMTKTPWVYPASHSFSHTNLVLEKNLEKEILDSKRILEKKLSFPIESFVYPFGKFNVFTKRLVSKHYRYQFRIGSSINFSWESISGITYRIPLDQKTDFFLKKTHLFRWLLNVLRGR